MFDTLNFSVKTFKLRSDLEGIPTGWRLSSNRIERNHAVDFTESWTMVLTDQESWWRRQKWTSAASNALLPLPNNIPLQHISGFTLILWSEIFSLIFTVLGFSGDLRCRLSCWSHITWKNPLPQNNYSQLISAVQFSSPYTFFLLMFLMILQVLWI